MFKPDLRLLIVALLVVAGPVFAGARGPKLSKYPLRVHILATDQTRQLERMTPAESVACDAIGDMVSSISPDPGGPISLTGLSGDPCMLHPEIVAGRALDINPYTPLFAGTGRADLVSPPDGTTGFSFDYKNCMRVRVISGFASLPARWKKPGRTLEVLLPSDEIPTDGESLSPTRCTLDVTVHEFVYLLLENGRIIEVAKEDYWKKPALRIFLSGYSPTVQQRLNEFTVPARSSRSRNPSR